MNLFLWSKKVEHQDLAHTGLIFSLHPLVDFDYPLLNTANPEDSLCFSWEPGERSKIRAVLTISPLRKTDVFVAETGCFGTAQKQDVKALAKVKCASIRSLGFTV